MGESFFLRSYCAASFHPRNTYNTQELTRSDQIGHAYKPNSTQHLTRRQNTNREAPWIFCAELAIGHHQTPEKREHPPEMKTGHQQTLNLKHFIAHKSLCEPM
jgi:hypothetical protein